MKKWIVGVIAVLVSVVLLVAGKQAFSYLYNQRLISEYEQENYDANMKPLYFMNYFQPYIAHYNAGNLSYKKEDYDEAIEEYKSALNCNPPEEKECSIRINLALAMVYGMGDDYAAPENIEASIKTLEEARDILLEKGCASDDGQGHNENAQKLKEEIDDLIEQLKKIQQDSSGDQPQNKPDESNTGDEDQELMEQLQQNQADAHQEREDNMDLYQPDDWDYNWDSDYDGIW